jgi:hypothetical protein
VSGRHEYGVWCEPGAIFLRCVHCSRRSAGWSVNAKALIPFQPEPSRARTERRTANASAATIPAQSARILPFVREVRREPDQPDLRQAG